MTDPSSTSSTPAPSTKKRRPIVWIVVAVVVALVLFVGGPFLYINVIKEDAPPPLALPTTTAPAEGDSSTTTAAGNVEAAGIDGSWTVSEGTQVGYRVQEVLFGQSTEGVGRTTEVDGTLTVDGTSVTAVDLTVDMTTVASDSTQRDSQFSGRIMETSTHPTATFVLTEPIDLGKVPADGETVTVSATGDLTLKGTTKSVTFELQAQRSGDSFSVVGAIPIAFADYGITNPSGGPAQVGDTGTLELLVVLSPA